jgi:hypothetical protein
MTIEMIDQKKYSKYGAKFYLKKNHNLLVLLLFRVLCSGLNMMTKDTLIKKLQV